MADNSRPLLCPSSRCTAGARLIGIVQQNGTVTFTPDDLRIDEDFVRIAEQGRKPESRFRFAGPCQRAHCAQWAGERCGVIDLVLSQAPEAAVQSSLALPNCSIRSKCRWFDQSGAAACRACPLVITEID